MDVQNQINSKKILKTEPTQI